MKSHLVPPFSFLCLLAGTARSFNLPLPSKHGWVLRYPVGPSGEDQLPSPRTTTAAASFPLAATTPRGAAGIAVLVVESALAAQRTSTTARRSASPARSFAPVPLASSRNREPQKQKQQQGGELDGSSSVVAADATETIEDQIHEMSVFLALRMLRTLQGRMKEMKRGAHVQPGAGSTAPAAAARTVLPAEPFAGGPSPPPPHEEKPKSLHRREGDRVVALGDDFFTEDRSSEQTDAALESAGADAAVVVAAASGAEVAAATTSSADAATGDAFPETPAAPIPSTVSLEFGRPLEVVQSASPVLSPAVVLKVEQDQLPPSQSLEVDAPAAIMEGKVLDNDPTVEPEASKIESSGSFMSLDTLSPDAALEERSTGDESFIPQERTSTETAIPAAEASSEPFRSGEWMVERVASTADSNTDPGAEVEADVTAGSGFVMLSSSSAVVEEASDPATVSMSGQDPSSESSNSGAIDETQLEGPTSKVTGSGFALSRANRTMDGSNVSPFSSSSSSTALSSSVVFESEVDTLDDTSYLRTDALGRAGEYDDEEDGRFSPLFLSEGRGGVDRAVLVALESTFARTESLSTEVPVESTYVASAEEPEREESTIASPNSLDSMIDFVRALEKHDASASTLEASPVQVGSTPAGEPGEVDPSLLAPGISKERLSSMKSVGTVSSNLESHDTGDSSSESIPIRKNWSPYGQAWKGSDKGETTAFPSSFRVQSIDSKDDRTTGWTDPSSLSVSDSATEIDPTDCSTSERASPIGATISLSEPCIDLDSKAPVTNWSPYGKRWTSQHAQGDLIVSSEPTISVQPEIPASDRNSDAGSPSSSIKTNWMPSGRTWNGPTLGEPAKSERVSASVSSPEESVIHAGRWNPFKTTKDPSSKSALEPGLEVQEPSIHVESHHAMDSVTVPDDRRVMHSSSDIKQDPVATSLSPDVNGQVAESPQAAYSSVDSPVEKNKWNPFQSRRQRVSDEKTVPSSLDDTSVTSSSQRLTSTLREGPATAPPKADYSGFGARKWKRDADGLRSLSPVIDPQSHQETPGSASSSFVKNDLSKPKFTLGYQWHGDNWASSTLKPIMAKPPSLKDSVPSELHPRYRTEKGNYVWYTIPKYAEIPRWQAFAKYSGIHWTRPDHED